MTNYRTEILYLKWLIDIKVTDPELQKAILSNLLVNNMGRPDSFLDINLEIEYVNRAIKTVYRERHVGNIDQRYLLEYNALQSIIFSSLRQFIDQKLDIYLGDRYQKKIILIDILVIADRIREAVQYIPDRMQSFAFDYFLSTGILIFNTAITNFNKRFAAFLFTNLDKLLPADGIDKLTTFINPLNDYDRGITPDSGLNKASSQGKFASQAKPNKPNRTFYKNGQPIRKG